MKTNYSHILFVLLLTSITGGCNKILDVKDPINSITSNQVFLTDEQAGYALNGMYSYLINGGTAEVGSGQSSLGTDLFSAGGVTMMTGYSSDELYDPAMGGNFAFYNETVNNLTVLTPGKSGKLWTTAYKAIYNANSLIEGVNEATSKELTEAGKKRIKGEALAIRAMSYFYLVNLFEKIPLALTIDFNKTKGLPSANPNDVYTQIINDLEESIGYLSDKFEGNNIERIRVSKWYSKALLARVYLYRKNYSKAYELANDLIQETSLFKLEDLNTVFKYNSREVIFQLKQDNTNGNATPEGYSITGAYLTPQLLNAFEPGDNRRTEWTKDITAAPSIPAGTTPSKYKLTLLYALPYGFRSEYYVVIRLAEMYLIRAEANLLLNAANKNKAIDDLNALRGRAGLTNLPYTLTDVQVTDAIAQERRVELFAEWGHRWLDLKRTNKANDVLSQISYKQPWKTYQLLYPVPRNEIVWDNNLSQNIGYY
jgi:hypothetical protein